MKHLKPSPALRVVSAILLTFALLAVFFAGATTVRSQNITPPASIPTAPPPTSPLAEQAVVSPASWQIIDGTRPVTLTISNVFWDTPPRSGSVAILNDKQMVLPGPEDEVRVIIQLKDEPVAAYKSHLLTTLPRPTNAARVQIRAYADELHKNQQRVISEIKQQGIELKVRREYIYIFNGLAASIKMKDMKQIHRFPGVNGVYPDYAAHALLKESVPLIGADQVWDMGMTGEGIEVAILDTGVDYTHPDLGGCFGVGCKVVAGYDFVNDDPDPWDDNGHGTHVAGIVAANGAVKGVAPDATLYAYKVLDQNGSGWDSDIIAAIERATDPDGNPATDDAIDVINISLGGSGDPDEPLALAVDAAVDEGVVVAVAAGNSGPSYQTVGSPGVARKALTVGATDKSDYIASFSSRGPVSGFYELIKPDIVAPGVSISSTVPISGELGSPERYLYLNGTSMATPHIAGAAALIKQLHPDWTPEMIKANLMNTAKDIGLDIYTQGAGRVQVNEAAVAQAVVVPGSVSFGVVDIAQPVWAKSKDLLLTNPTASLVSYSLQVTGDLPNGVTTDINPTNVTLGAGESVTVTLAITVDNALLSYPNEMPYAYEGKVLAQSGTQALVIPFAFIKSPMLNITFDEEPWIVLIHNRDDESWHFGWPGTSLSVLLPQGTYDVNILYPGVSTRVVREGIAVSTITNLYISKSEAIYQVDIIPVDKDGHTVNANIGSESFIHQASGIGVITSGGFPTPKYFSRVSTDYFWEWTSGAYPANDEFYVFNGQSDGISSSMTFENTPADFNHLTYQYHVDPGIEEIYVQPWRSYLELNWAIGGNSSRENTVLGHPFKHNAYLMPAPTSDFHWYNQRKIYEYTGPDFNPFNATPLFTSPFLQAVTTSQVEGYLWGSSVPIFSSSSDQMRIGLSPPRWSARLRNVESEIRVDAITGHRNYFYLTQMGDFKPNTGLSYELYQDETLITSGTFESAGGGGYGPHYESIEVTPGAYTLKVPYPWYYIGDQQGNAMMTATFDTRRFDSNPPFLTSLNLFSSGEPTDVIAPSGSNEVKFGVEDDTSLGDVSLFYRTDGSWNPLSLTNGSEYTAQLPELPNGSYVSLMLVAEDVSGNRLTYEMSPAAIVALASPVPLKPADDWTTGDPNIHFTWKPAPSAIAYQIQIDTVDTFDSPNLINVEVQDTTYFVTLDKGAWYWRVFAKDSQGNTSHPSTPWRFSVVEAVIQVTTDPGSDYRPALTQASDGTLWAVWQSSRDGNTDIWSKRSTDSGETWDTPQSLTTYTGSDYMPAITNGSGDRLWVAWYSSRNGNYDIWSKHSTDGGSTWTEAQQVTTDPSYDNAPALTYDSTGRLWLAWRSDRSGNADIWGMYSTDDGQTWTETEQLTTSSERDSYPTVAEAGDGAVWVMWERNGRLWYRTLPAGETAWAAEIQLDDECCKSQPSLTVATDGVMWLGYDENSSSIWYRTSADNGAMWSDPTAYTRYTGPDYDVALAALDAGRVGLAWMSDRSGNWDVWYGIPGEHGDINPPPYVQWSEHQPYPNPDSDDPVSFRARVTAETEVTSVELVWTLDSVAQANLVMFDDGAHGDDGAGDEIYGVEHVPFAEGSQVSYQVRATDNDGNTYLSQPRSFTVLASFVKSADILFVPDYGGNDTAWFQPYYTDALDVLDYDYDVWDTRQRGAPDSAVLNLYSSGTVIWASPEWGYYYYGDVRPDIEAYLNAGGKLFITGQDVAQNLNGTTLLSDYLHADYVQQDTGLYGLLGTASDPIGGNLNLNISGGDGANNQYSKDEIDPLAPAEVVFTYDGAASQMLAVPERHEIEDESGAMREEPLSYERKQPGPQPAPQAKGGQVSVWTPGPEANISSGTAGVRVDTGTYKVVYFAFGFEGINSAADQTIVMERVLAWLGGAINTTVLYLDPPTQVVYEDATFTIDIMLDAGPQPVNNVELYIDFDPSRLQVVDASGNPTTTIEPELSALNTELLNIADNATGNIRYDAGRLSGTPPDGTFRIATIRFKALAETASTSVAFTAPSDVFYNGVSVLGNSQDATVEIQPGCLDGTVALQSHPSPAGYPITLSLFNPGDANPASTHNATLDANSNFSICGLAGGVFDVGVKGSHSLSSRRANVTIPPPAPPVDFCTLLEGDASDADRVSGVDFSILATAYNTQTGDAGFDPRADFNDDGRVSGVDFSLLATNYNKSGPITCTTALNATALAPLDNVNLTFDPASQSAELDDIITLDFALEAGDQALNNVELYIDFDPTILQVVDAGGNPTTTIEPELSALNTELFNSADNATGLIRYDAGKLTGTPPTGTFRVATARFKVVSASPDTTVSYTAASDVFFGGVSVVGTLGSATIQSAVGDECARHDLTNDGFIDLDDINLVLFNSIFTGAPYDEQYDLVPDGVVDIADIFAVAIHFGEVCP